MWTFAKKQFAYDVFDDRYRCVTCGKPIKKRLVHQKKTPPRHCFRCFHAKDKPNRPPDVRP